MLIHIYIYVEDISPCNHIRSRLYTQHQWGATYVSKQNMQPYSSVMHSTALIPNETHEKSKFWFPPPYVSIPKTRSA